MEIFSVDFQEANVKLVVIGCAEAKFIRVSIGLLLELWNYAL